MLTLTAVFEEQEDHSWIAWVEELPGANTQGDTFDEAKENLADAIGLVLAAHREDSERELQSRKLKARSVVREHYCFTQ